MKKLFAFIALTMISANAMADQCQVVTHKQAKEAVAFLREVVDIQYRCEPCGETTSEAVVASSIGIRKYDRNLSEVLVNGRPIDLAYTFVAGLNLAKLVGCDTFGVSDELK